MENYWTSIKPINGLRHFVLVNETKEKGNIIFLELKTFCFLFNLRRFLKLKKINIKRKIITIFKNITLQVSYFLSTFLI